MNDLKISFVRNVAPHKDMMRASFPLTLDLLTVNYNKIDTNKVEQEEVAEPEPEPEPESKKQKMSL